MAISHNPQHTCVIPRQPERGQTRYQADPEGTKTVVEAIPILVDTREPDPHPWETYLSRPMVRGTLETGDFTLPGCGEWICIERKELNDLIACLCSNRERFTRELQRAARVKDFYVICEGSYADICAGRYRSAMNPNSTWESVVALQQRFGIPFLFAGSPELAAKLTQSILARWLKEHVKAVQTMEKASRSAAI